jgi:putative membrane protein
MEVAMGGLASTKAEAVGVKQYGQQLMKDHRLADQMVADLAKQENVRLEAKAHSPSERETMERLKKASKSDFDREFLNAMVEDHEKDIDMVKRVQSETDDLNLKGLLQKLLPTLEQHLDTARGLLSQTR